MNSADGAWVMSVSLGYLSHAKKEIQTVHELVHGHRLSVAIAIGAHKAITVHIKNAKDFQRNESRERQSYLLFVSFSR